MDGENEFDDVKVVSVTGKGYRDKPRHKKEKKKCWNPSLRLRTVLFYLVVAIIFIVVAVVGVNLIRDNLEVLDREALQKSIDRFTMLFWFDIGRLIPYTRHAAWQRVTAEAAMNPSKENIDRFVQRFLNTSVVYHPDGTAEHVYRCGSLINYWGILAKNFTTLWYDYHPGQNGQYCTLPPFRRGPPPKFPEAYFRSIILSKYVPENGWVSVFCPAVVTDTMTISIEAIMIPDDNGNITDKTVYGYLVAAKTIEPHLSTFADNIPGCISMVGPEASQEYRANFDETDWKMWNSSVAGTFSSVYTFTGVPNFTLRDSKYLKNCPVRYCPSIPLFNDTEKMMTGYFNLCGLDPNKVRKDRITCMNFRLDRPMSRVTEGTNPVIMLAVLIVLLMIILFILFIIFLDLAVLRRVVNLSNIIRKQTQKQREVFKDVDERVEKKRARKNSDDDSVHGGDEIKNLKLAVEQNTYRLRKRVEAINDVIKMERQRIVRHKQAMQLLSLWCDRNEFFPGLRPNAMLLRYEPTRSLDDLLSNPLAVEYLKSHCDTDCTLENLFFLLDVSWLLELEIAEDAEQDPAKAKQIHDVASDTALTIIERYIAEDAPQQINISSAAFKVIRDMGKSYKRGMFDGAVGEVKLMLSTDILPRFQSSTAYTAMSENLYVDAFASEEDSGFSSETVSTAGSVLSDEADAGVSNMVAFNFRNLYSKFESETDLGSTCTNELSVIDYPATESTIVTEAHTEIRLGTVASSNRDPSDKDSSSSESDDSD